MLVLVLVAVLVLLPVLISEESVDVDELPLEDTALLPVLQRQ